MKKQILALSVAAIFSGISVAQAEVTLFDYQEATSNYEEAYINGSFNASKDRDDAQTQYNFTVDTTYDRTISTPNRDLNFGGDIKGTVSRSGAEDADSVDSYTASASVTADNYFQPNSNGAFWYGEANVENRDDYDNIASEATVGLGYGRTVNATPMAKVIRLMDELASRGLLNSRPSKAAHQELAKIVDRENEYYARYRNMQDNEAELRWIGDMEKVLRESGALKKGNASGIALTMRQVMLEDGFLTRRIGWKVRGGVGYVFSTPYDNDGSDSNPKLDLGAEYHMPLSKYTQFSNEAKFTTVLDDGDDNYIFNNTMAYGYEIDDYLTWRNTWELGYEDSTEITRNRLTSGVLYELNNTLDLGADVTVVNDSGSANDGTDTSFNTSLRYRLR